MNSFISLIFFLSGCAALIFETLWFHEAGLAFGNSVWSVALVTSSFMAGLAFGNYLIARYGDQYSHPIRIYANLEILIAISGILAVLLLTPLSSLMAPFFSVIFDSPLVLNSVRLSFAFMFLLIPTTAMGATLPLLVKTLYNVNSNYGLSLGQLYGWNTIGAVSGTLLVEIILIKWIGITSSAMVAGLLNLVAALLALQAIKLGAQCRPTNSSTPPLPFSFQGLSSVCKRLLFASFLFGGSMLALEVLWFRFLLLIQHSSTLIFAVMLAVTLAGIGLGGLLSSLFYRFNFRFQNDARVLGILIGVMVVATYSGFEFALSNMVPITSNNIAVFVLLSVFLMLPVAMLSGMLFPAIGNLINAELQLEVKSTALLTLSNTVGAALGALIAGFVLLPILGMERSFFSIAVVYGVTIFILPKQGQGQYIKQKIILASFVSVLIAYIVLFPFGLMKESYFKHVEDGFAAYEGAKTIAVREGLTETIFYMQTYRLGEPFYHRLVTNSFGMAATSTQAKRYMKLFAYWPAAHIKKPRSALLISFGLGSTAKSLIDIRALDHIDIVDISRDILDMSNIVYTDPKEHPLRDERVKVYIEDGRFFLQATDKRYDIITGEPPPPKHAGVTNLYTQEYFQLVYDRLNESGITTYWLPTHLLFENESLSIIKSFCNVFKDCSLWAGTSRDWMLVGSRNFKGPVDIKHFEQLWQDDVIGKELKDLGIEKPAQLGSLFLGDAKFLHGLTKQAFPVIDNYPQRISTKFKNNYNAYSRLYAVIMEEKEASLRFVESGYIGQLWPKSLIQKSLSFFPYQRMIKLATDPVQKSKTNYFWGDLHNVLTKTELKTLPLWLLGSNQDLQDIVSGMIEGGKNNIHLDYYAAIMAITERDYGKAVHHFKNYLKMSSSDILQGTYFKYIFALCMNKDFKDAEQIANKIISKLSNSDGEKMYWTWIRNKFGLRIQVTEDDKIS